MSTWVGPPAWTAAGFDRRPHLFQGLAIAAAISLGVHFVAMLGSRPTLTSRDGPVAVHAVAVRTIVLPAPVAAAPEPMATATPEATRVEPDPTMRVGQRDAGTAARSPGEHSMPAAEGGHGVDAASPARPERAAAADPRTRSGPAAKPPAPAYFPAGQLDPPPRPLHDIEPVYPPEAGFQPGKVVLRLLISATGAVDRVDVLRATPPGLFEASAREAFAAARFSPGRLAGIAVKCEMTIEVDFTPINRGGEVSGRTY